jgi:DNA-binding transcriptional MerR regulator
MAPTDEAAVGDMTIDELAQRAGTTVRNVRAYRERGLLPPPRRRGRVGVYSAVHLARLRLIGVLLQRGYSLANIGELLDAWERGHDVADLLGLELALSTPWVDEAPSITTEAELLRLFAPDVSLEDADEPMRDLLRQALRMGIVVRRDDQIEVRSPVAVQVGAALVGAGVPADELVREMAELRTTMTAVATGFVELVLRNLLDPVGTIPPPGTAAELADLVQRLRPLVRELVGAELARAMDEAIGTAVTDRLGRAAGVTPFS